MSYQSTFFFELHTMFYIQKVIFLKTLLKDENYQWFLCVCVKSLSEHDSNLAIIHTPWH